MALGAVLVHRVTGLVIIIASLERLTPQSKIKSCSARKNIDSLVLW